MSDLIHFAKTHDVMVGPGRGSSAGSLVSYLLGITTIDPIKFDLLFERFLNPERVTMPDIDIDFEDTRRKSDSVRTRKVWSISRIRYRHFWSPISKSCSERCRPYYWF